MCENMCEMRIKLKLKFVTRPSDHFKRTRTKKKKYTSQATYEQTVLKSQLLIYFCASENLVGVVSLSDRCSLIKASSVQLLLLKTISAP